MSMESRRERRIIAAALLPVLGALAWLAVQRGAPGAAGVLLALPVAVAVAVAAGRRLDPHQIDLAQKKSYSITLKSVLATALVTGFVVTAVLVATGAVMAVVTAAWGYRTLSVTVLAEALARLDLLLHLSPGAVLGIAFGTSVACALSFWLLYPYLPIEDEDVAGPVTFLLAGAALWAVARLTGLGAWTPTALALDAALVALWGHFFAIAYEDVEAYVP